MIREYIVKFACFFLMLGLTAGTIIQIELLKPGILLLSETAAYSYLLPAHIWLTSISLLVIFASTISLIRQGSTLGHWAVWLGGALFILILAGAPLQLTLSRLPSDTYLADTYYLTASRHAYGIAFLLASLGGLTALIKIKVKTFPLKISFGFASLITLSGSALTILQAGLGQNGLPRRYIDYPEQFADPQFYSSVAAMACFGLSVIYIIMLWRGSRNASEKSEDIFS